MVRLMRKDEIWNEVMRRYQAEKYINPAFPDHVCAQVSTISAKVGLMVGIALQKKYQPSLTETEYKEMLQAQAIDTIVQSIRFLENLK